jgi:hypothetical protein
MEKIFTEAEKHNIRNQWCDQMCMLFKRYHKTGKKEQIRVPIYTAKVLASFGILDFNKIDFSEPKVNILPTSSRTNNEDLIYTCFDELIKKKVYINDFMIEFRQQFNDQVMPY